MMKTTVKMALMNVNNVVSYELAVTPIAQLYSTNVLYTEGSMLNPCCLPGTAGKDSSLNLGELLPIRVDNSELDGLVVQSDRR